MSRPTLQPGSIRLALGVAGGSDWPSRGPVSGGVRSAELEDPAVAFGFVSGVGSGWGARGALAGGDHRTGPGTGPHVWKQVGQISNWRASRQLRQDILQIRPGVEAVSP